MFNEVADIKFSMNAMKEIFFVLSTSFNWTLNDCYQSCKPNEITLN